MVNPAITDQHDTKTRILDAAEILFAQHGYKRTSIKALAHLAQVNLAAVNYHFGTKHALVEKVIERRVSLINALRLEKLQQIEEEAARRGIAPDVQALLRAFIEPVFTATVTLQKGLSFLMIEGRAFAEPDDAIRDIFIRHFKPAFACFSGLMQTALPDLPAAVLQWRLHFVIGAFAHALRVCGARQAPGFFPPADAPETVVAHLVAFLGRGMTAPYPAQAGMPEI